MSQSDRKFVSGVAQSIADGTPLPEVLRVNGITLDRSQTRALCRTEEFLMRYPALPVFAGGLNG